MPWFPAMFPGTYTLRIRPFQTAGPTKQPARLFSDPLDQRQRPCRSRMTLASSVETPTPVALRPRDTFSYAPLHFRFGDVGNFSTYSTASFVFLQHSAAGLPRC